jgi:competence ComEA-like helix-hairpin-helix protein
MKQKYQLNIELSDELIQEQPAEEVPLDMPEWLVAPVEERATVFDWSPPPVPPTESVNLNTASLVEIEKIPGVGFIRAQNIISYRENNGPFTDLAQLSNVPGMTSDIVASIQDYVYRKSNSWAASGEGSIIKPDYDESLQKI